MANTTGQPQATAAEIRAQVSPESPAVDHLPWKVQPIRFGVMGVNLTAALDALEPTELARLTNGLTQLNGGIHTRPGLSQLIAGGAKVHSAYRLNDPKDGASVLVWGVDSQLAIGNAGAFNYLLGGFSGNPLSVASWESEYSGEPWAYVADTGRMAKVNPEGVALQIGLPKAPQPSSITVQDPLVTPACSFTASDGTGSGSWTPIAGVGLDGHPTDVPTIYGAGDTQIVVGPGTSAKAFWSGMSIAHVVDLSTLPNPLGGTIKSTDQDLIHLSIRVTNPSIISEVRIYFVVGPYTDKIIPGTEHGSVGSQPNASAYARAFRTSDYTNFINLEGTALEATDQSRAAAITALQAQRANAVFQRDFARLQFINQQIKQLSEPDLTKAIAQAQAQFNPLVGSAVSSISSAQLPGADVWTEYGVPGLPLRKSDFLKIGNAGQTGFDWSNISGVVVAILTNQAAVTTISFDDMYLTGGYELDTSEPDSQKYDYRVCNVDKRTGARSNPSDVMYTDPATKLTVQSYETARQLITVQPVAFGDGNIYQEAYRRGGSLGDSWYGPIGDNKATGDGQPITDSVSDVEALADGAIEIDHDQPVTTTDEAGNAVYGQPLGFLLPGPINGYLIGGGDPYRPGDIYWCKQGEPDHWPAFSHQQVCPPSETLMNGGMYGGQAFVFSRERLYGVQVGIGDPPISSNPTDCAQGLIGRWAMAVGPGGIYFASRDAVRVTSGGLSKPLSDKIRPLFHGETVNGYLPIDFSQPDAIRLAVVGDDLWFGFIDTGGSRIWWVFSLIYQTWRAVSFLPNTCMVYADPTINAGIRMIVGATATGVAWLHQGATDAGTAFTVHARTGALLAGAREEKLLGDMAIWGVFPATDVSVTPLLNVEQVTDTVQISGDHSAYRQYIFQPFGTVPQHASSISLDVSWLSGSNPPAVLTQFDIAIAPQPEITMTRATTWQPINTNGEAYLTGAWIDCDTFGATITVVVEALRDGVRTVIATLSILSDAGRRLWFDWSAVHVDMIRLRPVGECPAWMLYGQGWLWRPEPANLPGMDSGFVNLGDTYYTGLDLEIDTGGMAKRVLVEVDGVVLSDPATALGYWTIAAAGRRLVHMTLPWGRGHIYRFYSTDGVPVLLYTSKWYVAEEPSEQANWNQNFTIAGTLADKWIKGILLECDTFGATKSVNVDVDGVPVPGGPFPVLASGRSVVQIAFPQVLGRVFRIFPADSLPGRLYSSAWLFDQEPYQLTRFETQEIRLDIDDWKMCTYGQITYKAAAAVNFQCLVYGQDGQLIATDNYTLAATAGIKAMTPFRPRARKGVLYKYIITSAQGFWLYREESWVEFQPWQGGATTKLKPFGNDDLDQSRSMVNAGLVASRSGGGG